MGHWKIGVKILCGHNKGSEFFRSLKNRYVHAWRQAMKTQVKKQGSKFYVAKAGRVKILWKLKYGGQNAIFSRGTLGQISMFPEKGGQNSIFFPSALKKGGQNRGAYQPTSLKGCWGWSDNYVNPVYCHVLCCHCLPPGSLCVLGVLAHFHRAISYLKWYKIVCMRWLACTFSQIKLTCSLCFCTLEFPDISFGDLLRFDHRTSLFSCLRRWMLTPISSGNMQKHGYLICFHAAFTSEIYLGFWSFDVHQTIDWTTNTTSKCGIYPQQYSW